MYKAPTLERYEKIQPTTYSTSTNLMASVDFMGKPIFIAPQVPVTLHIPRQDQLMTAGMLEKMLALDAGTKLEQQARMTHDYSTKPTIYSPFPLVTPPRESELRRTYGPSYK